MSAPARLSYTIYQGATFRRGFRWCSVPYPTRVVNGKLVNAETGLPVPDSDLTPVDLTGCKARMQLRAEVLAPDVLLELTTENGRIDLGAGDGWIYFPLDDTTTGAIPYGDQPPVTWSEAISQLEVVHANGDVSRPVEISWRVDPESTR
ncbi:hypothetical protein V8Z74_19675 [Comamonas sp. w2-DMI]|uniref:hypothetical protein n=1 Tax=Comamonas sp. w2-DMI TaxID=3126391 RepID=UPI0032E3F7AE